MKLFTYFIASSVLVFAGCSTQTVQPTVSTLPILVDDANSALTQTRQTAADSEISHTVQDTNFQGYADAAGTLVDLSNAPSLSTAEQLLAANMTSYSETFFNNQDKVYSNKTSHYQCQVALLGHDDQYAYASVTCQDPGGSGFHIPFRFNYDSTSSTVSDFKEVGDDTAVGILFPKAMADAYNTLK